MEPDSDFNAEYLAAKRSGFPSKIGGPFDKFLTSIGLRNPDVDYQVGDTPSGSK